MIETIVEAGISSLMRRYVRYNLWANRKYVTWLEAKAPDLLERDIPSSFSSLKLTLLHIWDTERFWLSILQQVPYPKTFRDGFDGSLSDVLHGIVEYSETFAAYVNQLSETEIQETVTLVTPWVEGTRPRFEFILHCMNHSTYHRGQIVTIGRNCGITDAPMTDYNFYLTMREEELKSGVGSY